MERGRPESGVNAAARVLGISKDDAHRAVQVASLSEEAKEAARESGLDNNRSALLTVAKEATPEAQVAKVGEIAAAKSRSNVNYGMASRDIQPSGHAEAASLTNGLRVALAGLDPILDRIAQIGIDVFWREADERVREQVEGTAQFLQMLTTTGAMQHQHAATTTLRPKPGHSHD